MSNRSIYSFWRCRSALTCTSALILAACASLPEAQMRLPADLAGGSAVPISGIGGGNLGMVSAGQLSGSFERSETRLAVYDAIGERRKFDLRFFLVDNQTNGRINLECRMRTSTVTVDVVSVDAEPMNFVCLIDGEDGAPAGRLQLRSVREGLGGMLSLEERQGEVAFDGVMLQIRSSHQLEGTSLSIADPIGYVLSQNGQPVGAVSLNGQPILTFHSDADARLRRAVTVAGVAIGLFRDPAASHLGR